MLLHNLKIKFNVYYALVKTIFTCNKQLRELEAINESLNKKLKDTLIDYHMLNDKYINTRIERDRYLKINADMSVKISNQAKQIDKLLISLENKRREYYVTNNN